MKSLGISSPKSNWVIQQIFLAETWRNHQSHCRNCNHHTIYPSSTLTVRVWHKHFLAWLTVTEEVFVDHGFFIFSPLHQEEVIIYPSKPDRDPTPSKSPYITAMPPYNRPCTQLTSWFASKINLPRFLTQMRMIPLLDSVSTCLIILSAVLVLVLYNSLNTTKNVILTHEIRRFTENILWKTLPKRVKLVKIQNWNHPHFLRKNCACCPSPTSCLSATKATYRPLMLGTFSTETGHLPVCACLFH